MRILTPVLLIVGAFIAIDKGFGLLNGSRAATRQEMRSAGQEMYRIAEDGFAGKSVNGAASTKMGKILQRLTTKTQLLERQFEKKYASLNTFMDKSDWLGDKARVKEVLALSKTWADEGMAMWEKERVFNRQFVEEVTAELRLQPGDPSMQPSKECTEKIFAIYKKMIDQDGRRFFKAMADYLTFALKHHGSLAEQNDTYYWPDPKIHNQALELNNKMRAAAGPFADTADAFEQQRAYARANAARSLKAVIGD